jgi:predicted TIM-barrel fold metal-dependent hydrolase
MRIDIHTHFQCLDFVKHLQGRTAMPKAVRDGGTYVIQCAAGLEIPSLPKLIDMDAKLRDMDEMKIDVAVLSHGIPFGPDVLGGDDADDWAARINDDLARIIAMFPGRLAGLGAIGFGDRRRSIAEVDRCVRELGFRGFQVFSNITGRQLDSPEVLPVLKHIGSIGAPVHLHPAVPLNRTGLDAPSLFLSLGFPSDTSLNIVRLIRSGIFDEAPDLKVIVAHAGGVLPYLFGRIAGYSAPSALASGDARLPHPIEHYLGNLFVDTICYHKPALECCYQVMGAERMLYGTDHPFGPFDVAAELVDRLDCPASHRELIWHGNAGRLLKLNERPMTA